MSISINSARIYTARTSFVVLIIRFRINKFLFISISTLTCLSILLSMCIPSVSPSVGLISQTLGFSFLLRYLLFRFQFRSLFAYAPRLLSLSAFPLPAPLQSAHKPERSSPNFSILPLQSSLSTFSFTFRNNEKHDF